MHARATSDDRLAAIRVDGFCIIEHAIDDALVHSVRAELAPWLKGEHFGRNDFEGFRSERVYALLSKAPTIAALIEHPAVLELVDALLPPHFLLSAALAIQVHPGETPQNFHIDDAGGGFPLKRPRPMLGVSTMWALDDFTAANGATEMVVGSHLWEEGRLPTPRDVVQAIMPAGSVLVFAGNLLHRGGANTARTTRLGITPQYCAPFMRQLENMVLAVPPATAARYSPRIQALLGYSVVEPGFMGYVDGLHPRRLLNANYQGRRARGLPS
jgi:ectoine hydroxylase-related dioxygenase (phytanoyl-CoA dioxygenase family)